MSDLSIPAKTALAPPTAIGIGTGRMLAGLVGRGILESRSPWMHEQEAAAQGLRMVYALFDFADRGWDDDELGAAIDAAQRIGFAGLNVTFPFKQQVLSLVDDLSPQAAAIGAVNTIAFRGGRRIGYNTDVTGFASAFVDRLKGARLDRVLQLGCGGAGSATAHALLSVIGAGHVTLFDTDPARATALAAHLADIHGPARVAVTATPALAAAQADGLVNATPIGMDKFPGMPIEPAAIEARHWVAEIIYFPLETELLKIARALGCRTMSGRGMAVGQAVDAFRIITGRTADRSRMWNSFAEFDPGLPG